MKDLRDLTIETGPRVRLSKFVTIHRNKGPSLRGMTNVHLARWLLFSLRHRRIPKKLFSEIVLWNEQLIEEGELK